MLEAVAGILLGGFVFAALIWSFFRTLTCTGRTRITHALTVMLIIATMATLSLGWPLLGRITGLALVGTALFALSRDQGWARLLPFSAALWGAVMAAGIPSLEG